MPMNKVFDALSHPIRRDVLELLKSGGMTAGDLAEAIACLLVLVLRM